MKIYQAEIDAGLSHLLSSNASIVYASLVERTDKTSVHNIDFKALAGINDQDLYYTQSILVTTSWNKNDDIFDKMEVWEAKNTPTHKPTNIEHNEEIIVGHITSNYPITEDGILIDENTPIENLPDKFHILTGSVIYNGYTDPSLKDRSQKLISEIEDGSKYVSMECFFKGFDYGLLNGDTGEYKILARNEETAFLTKYLRAYGGEGKHQNYKLGRVLRNITFSGKGFVNKPANPESIIFTKNDFSKISTKKTDNLSQAGVYTEELTQVENTIMNLDLEPVMKEFAEIKTAMQSIVDAVALKEKAAELESVVKAHEDNIAELKAALEVAQTEKEEAAKKVKDEEDMSKEEHKMLKASLDAANEVIAAYKAKEEEMMKKEKKMKRASALINSGLASEVVEATLEKFDSLDDDSFEAMTVLLAAKKMAKEDKEKKEDKEEVKAEEKTEQVEASDKVDASVLESAEVEQNIDLSVGASSGTEVENTRAALVDFVCARLGKKLNKGE